MSLKTIFTMCMVMALILGILVGFALAANLISYGILKLRYQPGVDPVKTSVVWPTRYDPHGEYVFPQKTNLGLCEVGRGPAATWDGKPVPTAYITVTPSGTEAEGRALTAASLRLIEEACRG